MEGRASIVEPAREFNRPDAPFGLFLMGDCVFEDESREAGVKIVGRYERGGPDGLFAAIAPETRSYALGDSWKRGVPCAVFDTGATAERIRDFPTGEIVMRLDADAKEVCGLLTRFIA